MENNHNTENLKFAEEEKFLIEYPLNYEEIVNRKLRVLEREYEETMKCEIRFESKPNEGNEEKKLYLISQIENERKDLDNQDENNCEYYQQISDDVYKCLDDEGFLEVEEEENFVKVNEPSDENESESNLNCENGSLEGIEFLNDDKLLGHRYDKIEEDISKQQFKVNDPEKIKNAMKNINMKPPKWAENLNDDDFLKIVKNAIINKNFIKK